jgi:ATP-binding cassette subfamily B protein
MPESAPEKALSVRQLLQPHVRKLIMAILVVIGGSVADLLQPWPLKIVIDTVVKGKEMQGLSFEVVHWIAGEDRLAILRFAALAALCVAAFGALCSYAEKSLTTTIGQQVLHELRRTLYRHIQRLSLAYHDRKQTGDLISRVTSDIDTVQSFLASGLLGTLVSLMTLFGMIGVMFVINWRFTLIALSVAPALFLVIFTYTRRIKKASRAVRKKEGEMVSIIHEALSAVRVIRAFSREDYEQRRFEVESMESMGIALRARSLKARLSPLVEMIVAVGTSLVLWFGARMVLDGALSTGSLIVFILYLGRMYKPMQELSKMSDTITKASVAWERIQEVMDTQREVEDLPDAKPAPRFHGDIEFDHVSFAYDHNRAILRDMSLQIKAGQVAALVGPTGAGKTTVISLVTRFYDPTSGSVKIDGTDIRQFQQHSLRQRISLVLQETMLFQTSIWANIAYGKPGATREEILRAAELANAHEFIEKMPEGYDTVLGERGVTLSGGQRQRIAIARAVIRDTPIVIMDEPSSGLDAASERMVFDALDRLMAGKTCIVIAHRLSTIQRADVIFVVKEGAIVESGNHEQLLAQRGVYANLHDLQFRNCQDRTAPPAENSNEIDTLERSQ